jgi:hypothetical protein
MDLLANQIIITRPAGWFKRNPGFDSETAGDPSFPLSKKYKKSLTKIIMVIIIIFVKCFSKNVCDIFWLRTRKCLGTKENIAKSGTLFWRPSGPPSLTPERDGFTSGLNPGFPGFLWGRYTGISMFSAKKEP